MHEGSRHASGVQMLTIPPPMAGEQHVAPPHSSELLQPSLMQMPLPRPASPAAPGPSAEQKRPDDPPSLALHSPPPAVHGRPTPVELSVAPHTPASAALGTPPSGASTFARHPRGPFAPTVNPMPKHISVRELSPNEI